MKMTLVLFLCSFLPLSFADSPRWILLEKEGTIKDFDQNRVQVCILENYCIRALRSVLKNENLRPGKKVKFTISQEELEQAELEHQRLELNKQILKRSKNR